MPWIFREYTADIQLTTTVTSVNSRNSRMNGVSHSTFVPLSSRSRNVLENAGWMTPSRLEIVAVRITNATAVPLPRSRSFA